MFHESLSSGRTLVRYDRPGCGLSEAYDGPRTMALELATIAAVTEELGVTSCDVLGWSLGAAVAVQWAADHPDKVSRLVLYGGWATGAAIGDDASKQHMLGLLASHWGLGSDLLTELFAPDADAGTRLALARYQRAASSAETAVALLRLAYDLDVRSALPKVQARTLVLHRRGDRAAPLDQGRVLADAIPGARLVELQGRSHLPAFGDVESLVDQLRKLPRPATAAQVRPHGAHLPSGGGRSPRGGRSHEPWSSPTDCTSPNDRPSPTSSGSGYGSGSGLARRWPPGTSRSTRTSEVVPRLKRTCAGTQHGGMDRRPAHLFLSAAAWLWFNLVVVWTIAFLAGVVVPWTVDAPVRAHPAVATVVDLGLLLLFALQHSVMARRPVKVWLRRRIPHQLERTTYVVATNLCLTLLLVLWQPLGGQVWHVEGTVAGILWALFAVGWALAIAATFAVDHLELLGLRQAGWAPPRDAARTSDLQIGGLYAVVRHPLMTGMVLAFWATPQMGASHLLFAIASTGYIIVGTRFEERDLRRIFGASYDAYAARVPALVPRLPLPRRAVQPRSRQP